MSGGTRQFIAGVLAIAAVIPVAWWVLLREPAPRPVIVESAPPRDAGPGLIELRLADVVGSVQVRHGLDGGWEAAKAGQSLAPNDGVRTGDGSYALLVGGEYWDVKMEPGTEVGLGELSASISRLLLEAGMAHARVHGSGRHTFEVRAAASDAQASSDGGAFTMATNGRGTVALGTESGEVFFAGQGRVVIVRAGQSSVVAPGHAPSEPAPVPRSLLLKVALPGRTTLNTKVITVTGKSEPGALVEVQGRVVTTGNDGTFSTKLNLEEGPNHVEIKAQGVGGVANQSRHELELDTTVSAPVIDPSKLWK
jgi:Glucodextranase, domain B